MHTKTILGRRVGRKQALVVSVGLAALVSLSPVVGRAETHAVEVPSMPDAVQVQVDSQSTALIVVDMATVNCPPRPACVANVDAVGSLLRKARGAAAPVVFTIPSGSVIPELAPDNGEPVLAGGGDRFVGTPIDTTLRIRGVNTVILSGTAANSAVLYMAFSGVSRGYTVVVAEDTISADNDFATSLARYQFLTMRGVTPDPTGANPANPMNVPLKKGTVTVSRSDLIQFN